jgi:hypothetical protein
LWSFLQNDVVGTPAPRDPKWPLKHMAETYRRITPTFPGIYTQLESEEDPSIFPLENYINGSTRDYDVNHEIFGRPLDAN